MKQNIIESVLILVVVAATWLWWGERVWSLELRIAFGYAAAVILGQGLIRDLVRLRLSGRPQATRTLRCLCAESTLGLGLLLLGAGGLTCLGITERVHLDGARLPLTLLSVLVLGLLIKDYAVSIHRIQDHGEIRVF